MNNKKIDLTLFFGITYFGIDGSQNYLVFHPLFKSVTLSAGSNETYPENIKGF